MAARLTCERATDEEIASLRTLFATFEDGELRLRLDEYSAANLRFHQRIIELGRSPLLVDMADGLLVHVRAIRGRTIGDDDRAERSIVDHMHIIEALEARDAELAERLVRDHALDLADHVETHGRAPGGLKTRVTGDVIRTRPERRKRSRRDGRDAPRHSERQLQPHRRSSPKRSRVATWWPRR